MKKMILLLILPLTALMAIDFTMTEKGLFAETTTQSPAPDPTPGTVPGETSSYLEPVNLPECDAGNPEVQFIRSNADWSTINSSSKRIFCVSPGDYRSLGNITLTAKGTSEKRRYILLNNGNDTHPGKLDQAKLANLALRFSGSSYWTIDRFAAFNTNVTDAITISGTGSTNNIINRGFTDNYSRAVKIGDRAHNNTIQNCRFQNMKPAAMDDDQVSINLISWGTESFEIKNTKIINNEIVTSNDGIQLTRSPIGGSGDYYQAGNCEGTIIDGNHIWQDHATMAGATGEDAIDIKVGSDNPANPILITNNHFWNWDKEQSGGQSTAIVLHLNPTNVKITNNVFFDSGGAISTGSAGYPGFHNGMIDGEIAHNLIYNMFTGDITQYSIRAASMKRVDIHDNKFINCSSTKGRFYGNYDNSFFRNNIYVNFSGDDIIAVDNDSIFTNSLTSNLPATGYTKDYTFVTDKFTNNSRTITLKSALKAE